MTHVTILASPNPKDAQHARFVWRDEQGCARTAGALAQALSLGLHQGGSAVIELRGTLGAGKTTFTRHLLRALGVEGRIKSPSYAVVESYELPGFTAQHFDFYRFNDPQEWEDAGFRDLFAAPGLKIVEWPEKAAGLLPAPDLYIDIDMSATSDTERTVQMAARGETGRAALTAMQASPSPAETGGSSHD